MIFYDSSKKRTIKSIQEERKEAYLRKQEELKKRCIGCMMKSAERCEDCIIGLRLRWIETEYADVTGFSHEIWKDM